MAPSPPPRQAIPPGGSPLPPMEASQSPIPKRRGRRWLCYGALILALATSSLLLLLFAAPALFGYPHWFRQALADSFAPEGGTCHIRAMQGNLLTGLELNDVEVKAPLPAGEARLFLPTAFLSFRPLPMLQGKLVPKEIFFTGGHATLSPHADIDTDTDLVFSPLSGQFYLTLPKTLLGTLQGELQGFRLSLLLHLTELDDAEECLQALLPHAPDDPRLPLPGEETAEAQGTPPLPEGKTAEIQGNTLPLPASLPRLQEQFARFAQDAGEMSLSLRLTGSLKDPDSLALQGEASVADSEFLGRAIALARASFLLKRSHFSLDDLHIVYNPLEALRAQGSVDFLSRTVQGNVQAACMPRTILRLADLSPALLPPWLVFTSPMTFQGTLPPTPWNLHDAAPQIDFSTQELRVKGLILPRVAGTLSYQRGGLRLQNLELLGPAQEWTGNHPQSLQGEIAMDLQEKTLQGTLEGTLNVKELLHDLELLQSRDTPLEAFTNATLQIRLEPSPWNDWRAWKASVSLGQAKSSLGKFHLADLNLHLQANQGNLALDASSHLAGNSPNQLSLHLETSPAQDPRQPIRLLIRPQVTLEGQEVLSGQGALLWTPSDSTLQIADGECLFRPELLYQLLQTPLSLDGESVLAWFQCLDPGQPARLSFSMPQRHLLNPQQSWDWEKLPWQLEGTLDMPQMQMKQTRFSRISSRFHLTETQISFPQLQGSLQDSDSTLSADLTILFHPFRLSLENLRLAGPPLSFRNLLHDPGAIQIFDTIWEGFQWESPGTTPANEQCLIQLPLLEYRSYEGDKWNLNLAGTLEARHFRYRGLPLHSLHATLSLKLPEEGLRLTKISLQQGENPDNRFSGTLSLDFHRGTSGVFHGEKHSGEFPTLPLLASLLFHDPGKLQDFTLPPQANFTLHGQFHQGMPASLSMEGTLDTPSLQYKNIQLQNLQGKWKFLNNRLVWDFPTAEFFQGSLATTGFYDLTLKKSEFLANATGVPLAQLMKLSQGKLVDPDFPHDDRKYTPDTLPGKLDAKGHFAILKDWGASPIFLEGNGTLHLHEMDLWRVPTLTTLGKIISRGTFRFFSKDKIASLGKISTLDADFHCWGASIAFQDIRTDGSFIALRGNGIYRLDDNQMNFQVSGQLLKSVSLISWLLRPISWAFNAELTGTPQEHQWKLRSTLRNLFPGN